jgi:hypothetical protein
MAVRSKPATDFRLGRVKATVWANQAANGDVWYSVEIVRLYLDAEQWHESTSFGRDDLPLVAKAADMAFAWIWSQSRQASLAGAASMAAQADS